MNGHDLTKTKTGAVLAYALTLAFVLWNLVGVSVFVIAIYKVIQFVTHYLINLTPS